MTTPPPESQVAQSETLEQIADDLPYRIVEEMGLGLTFRSCTCGQLPCARLRPLRDALETMRLNTAVLMRDKCVEQVKRARKVWGGAAMPGHAVDQLIADLKSLTLDQVKPGEM